MFDTMNVNDSIGMNTQLSSYASGRRDLFGTVQDSTSFRQQRLGVYLLSDLFTAGFMSASEFVHDKRLVTLARDKTTTYTGETFDQWDLDVLIHCVTRSSVVNGHTQKVLIEPGKLLRSMNLRNTEMNQDHVFSSLWRLHTGSIMIIGKGYRYMTRLIDRVLLDEKEGNCLVEVNTDIVSSLKHERNLSLDVETRNYFRRNGLAKWLHGAVMTFKGGFVADTDSLHALCGAPARSKHLFPTRLIKALEIMEECCAIKSWKVEENSVMVVPNCMRNNGIACGYISPTCIK
ncbi:hypothetical protein [Pseudodesulfovibrio sediminis]|uniref:Uncharacterized protein n=1 Tax=Pseudodesulfovibrio sediminis TaxID=2810563 RepID=A0ABN6EY72_9BACT|nr:hypothetical protein [Pseudodesulfovibrio sediminis]BCS89773.1 hypothetical protein PSDVSF_30150 [Pseudodesulfovibrio sediminis]